MSNPWDTEEGADLRTNTGWVRRAFTNAQDAKDRMDIASVGAIACDVLSMDTNPTASNTVTIGSDVYEFSDADDDLADNTSIAVLIGVDLAASTLALIAAVNGTADNPHDSLLSLDESAAPGIGTELVVLDDLTGGNLRLRPADAIGGTPVVGSPDIATGESFTAAADVWKGGNANLNTQGGRDATTMPGAAQAKTIVAAHITNGARWCFPFTVLAFEVQIRAADGTVRGNGADAFSIANGDVVAAFGGGADPDTQATDIVTVVAWP